MRTADIFYLAVTSVFQRRLRSLLTILGVAIGTLLFFLTLTGGIGVSRAVERQYDQRSFILRVHASTIDEPSDKNIPRDDLQIEGQMSALRRERLTESVLRRHPATTYDPTAPLSDAVVDQWQQSAHVDVVVPDVRLSVAASHRHSTHGVSANRVSANRVSVHRATLVGVTSHSGSLQPTLVAGRPFDRDDANEILVHEYLAYRWGYHDEADVDKLVGQTVRLEYQKGSGAVANVVRWSSDYRRLLNAAEGRALDEALKGVAKMAQQLDLSDEQVQALMKAFGPDARKSDEATDSTTTAKVQLSAEFRVAGVFQDFPKEQLGWMSGMWMLRNADVLLPIRTARDFTAPVFQRDGGDYGNAMILVDSQEHVQGVVDTVESDGMKTNSLLRIIQEVRLRITIITGLLAGLALAAVVVAALGIANTMSMSVLERTHEIGVMKAMGARDSHVWAVFLAEGALLGLAGGAAGTLTGWMISLVLSGWVRRIVENEFQRPFTDPMFAFPLVIVLGVPLLVTFVTSLASVVPARRAARIDPIAALRSDF